MLYACDMEKVATASIPDEVKYRIINGYNRERSGSVAIVLKPNHYDHGMKGTDHGTWNPYDTQRQHRSPDIRRRTIRTQLSQMWKFNNFDQNDTKTEGVKSQIPF